MRTLTDLQAAFTTLERQAAQYAGTARPDELRVVSPPVGAGPDRRRWLLAVAATVAVGISSVGAAYLRSSDTGRRNDATGATTPMCIASLPAAWHDALHAPDIRVDGQPVWPVQVTPAGEVIVDWQAGGYLHVGQVAADASVRQIAQLHIPAGHGVESVAADSRSLVVVLVKSPAAGSIAGTDIVSIDRRTGSVTDLTAKAPVPNDYALLGHYGVLAGGRFYWMEVPATNTNAAATLLSYDLAAKAYSVIATGRMMDFQLSLGFFWNGGTLPLVDLPPVHAPVADRYQTVSFDGASMAWSLYDDPGTLHWSDTSGAARTLSQDLMSQVLVLAVSGPFVLLTYGEGDVSDRVNGNVHVLDTRTGALADTGMASGEVPASAHGVVELGTADGSATHLLKTAGLPELACPKSS